MTKQVIILSDLEAANYLQKSASKSAALIQVDMQLTFSTASYPRRPNIQIIEKYFPCLRDIYYNA